MLVAENTNAPVYTEVMKRVTSCNSCDANSGAEFVLYWMTAYLSSHELFSEAGHKARFMDQLVTWRELGFNMCAHATNYDRYESLPAWAQRTLTKHEKDVRPIVYSFEQLESASTHDPVWNAAQMQLLDEGHIHNSLRMLWERRFWSGRLRPARPWTL